MSLHNLMDQLGFSLLLSQMFSDFELVHAIWHKYKKIPNKALCIIL
jgi:hypothetical protein